MTKLEHRNLIQTIGLDQDLDKLDYDDSRWICLDVANGYTERFNDFVGLIEDMNPTKDKIIIRGNVCTPETNGTDNNGNRYCKNWDRPGSVRYVLLGN